MSSTGRHKPCNLFGPSCDTPIPEGRFDGAEQRGAGLDRGAQRGDQSAFARLVEAYKQPVINLAYRMLGNPTEAEDVAQEVFLRAYLKLGSYDRTRKFSTWLLGDRPQLRIDLLRRRRGTSVNLDDIEFLIESPEPGPEEIAVDNEQSALLARAIAALPPAYRLVTVLR